MEHYYKIAGVTVKMDTFGRTEEQAEPYRCDPAEPDMTVQGYWEALQQQQPQLSKEDCEYLSTGAVFYRQLMKFDGMMLHASAVVVDGWAYLFSAPCGTGKSTHTGIWRKVFGDRAVILNDDKPALRLEDGVWYAYGTPWSGKTAQNVNMRAKLAGICYLHQAKDNTIAPLTGAKAVYALMEQTARPASAQMRMMMLELLDRLIEKVPVWQMGCNMEDEAALVSFEAMSNGRKEG